MNFKSGSRIAITSALALAVAGVGGVRALARLIACLVHLLVRGAGVGIDVAVLVHVVNVFVGIIILIGGGGDSA